MPDRLAKDSSPFLRQHAHGLVDWWPWSDEALAAARTASRPLLLWIGQSGCARCRRVARERYADPAIAALINRHFVAVLVDARLRPDLLRCYQLACEIQQRQAVDCPLTVFLDPHDLLPFFIAGELEAQPGQALPAWAELLPGLSRWYAEHPAERAEQARSLSAGLRRRSAAAAPSETLHAGPLQQARSRWLALADREYGGRAGTPKRPRCTELAAMLQDADPRLVDQARLSLYAIASGGLQDHLGGGFFHCATDAQWMLPECDKRLLDNAMLLPLYAAAAAAGDVEARRAATGIAGWISSEMPLAEGGYAAGLAGDCAGTEGGFYLWQQDAFADAVPESERAWIARHLGLDRPPTCGAQGWQLRIAVPLAELAALRGEPEAGLRERRKAVFQRMALARARRTAPQRDESCLALPNALLLSGLARAAGALGRPDWGEQAVRLAADLRRRLSIDGRLRTAAAADAPAAFLDDHAALLLALLDLLEYRFDLQWLDWAMQLADSLLAGFEDREHGGFWLSAEAGEPLPCRERPYLDGDAPAGNALAAEGLARLASLLAEPRYLHAAERCLQAAWPILSTRPEDSAGMLRVLADWLQPRPLLVARLAGVDEAQRWNDVLRSAAAAGLRVMRLPAEAGMLPDALEDRRWLRGGRVYWCEGLRCLPRFDSPVALQARLEARRR